MVKIVELTQFHTSFVLAEAPNKRGNHFRSIRPEFKRYTQNPTPDPEPEPLLGMSVCHNVNSHKFCALRYTHSADDSRVHLGRFASTSPRGGSRRWNAVLFLLSICFARRKPQIHCRGGREALHALI